MRNQNSETAEEAEFGAAAGRRTCRAARAHVFSFCTALPNGDACLPLPLPLPGVCPQLMYEKNRRCPLREFSCGGSPLPLSWEP
ncbi:unnamed protein product [Urochloa humidicola]